MKAKFWYKDNWCGSIREFTTLKAARKAARKEDGFGIYIHRMDSRDKVEFVEGNGYTYP